MTFLPLPGTLICADTLRCLFVGERWGGEAAPPELWLKEKKKRKGLKEKPWLTFNRLISFGFIRLSPQTGPVAAALSLGCRWTCTQPAGLAGA